MEVVHTILMHTYNRKPRQTCTISYPPGESYVDYRRWDDDAYNVIHNVKDFM